MCLSAPLCSFCSTRPRTWSEWSWETNVTWTTRDKCPRKEERRWVSRFKLILREITQTGWFIVNKLNVTFSLLQLAIDYGIKFLETSAKSSINVEEVSSSYISHTFNIRFTICPHTHTHSRFTSVHTPASKWCVSMSSGVFHTRQRHHDETEQKDGESIKEQCLHLHLQTGSHMFLFTWGFNSGRDKQ